MATSKDRFLRELFGAREVFRSWLDAYPKRVEDHLAGYNGWVLVDGKKLVVNWDNPVEINNKIKELKKMLGVQ